MSFTIELRPEADVIELSFVGDVDHEQLLETRQRIRKILKKGGPSNALIDMQKINWCMSMSDIYIFAGMI